jgi:deoxycytidine triphosphate deaminase
LGDLEIAPLRDEALQIQPASVDLRLAGEFIVFRSDAVTHLDPPDIGSCCASFQSVVAHAEAIEIAGVLLEATLPLPDDA